jgi:hypothetical protein
MLQPPERQSLPIGWHGLPAHQVWADCQDGTGFPLARVAVDSGLPERLNRGFLFRDVFCLRDINDVIPGTGQLDLCKVMDQVIVASMGIDDHNFLQSIPGDFAAGVFEQGNDQVRFDANTTGIMARFQDLGKDKVRENDCRLQRRSPIQRRLGRGQPTRCGIKADPVDPGIRYR